MFAINSSGPRVRSVVGIGVILSELEDPEI